MRNTFIFILGLISCLTLATSVDAGEGHGKDKSEAKIKAKALVKGTAPESPIIGRIDFIEKKDGVKVIGHLLNVPPGEHGFHVHEVGSCEDAGKAAGDHFNPEGAPHGFLPKDGFKSAHAGDFGNVAIDEDGSGQYLAFLEGLNLSSGNHNIMGRSVILHANPDDFSQPTGNAGGRIGCGIIEVVE